MIVRALVVWLLLAVLAVGAGALRERVLTPRVGGQTSHVLGTVLVVTLMLVAIGLLVRWIVPGLETGRLLTVGLFWTVLTIAFEFGFGHFVVGHPWSRLLHDYNLVAGRIWVLVLVALLLGPLLLGRLLGEPSAAPPTTQSPQAEAPAAAPPATQPQEVEQEVESTWTVEFVKGRHGGLCVNDGGGGMCRAEVIVRDDGTWSAESFSPPAPKEGTVEEGAATRLAAIVETEWDALTARPFTGTCPMAYDGQELYYLVRRLPTGEGAELGDVEQGGTTGDADVRELRSCTHDFDHPAARRVLEKLEKEWAALGLPAD